MNKHLAYSVNVIDTEFKFCIYMMDNLWMYKKL